MNVKKITIKYLLINLYTNNWLALRLIGISNIIHI